VIEARRYLQEELSDADTMGRTPAFYGVRQGWGVHCVILLAINAFRLPIRKLVSVPSLTFLRFVHRLLGVPGPRHVSRWSGRPSEPARCEDQIVDNVLTMN
jgi:hypothetical protein